MHALTFYSPSCHCTWEITLGEPNLARCFDIQEAGADSFFPTPCPDRCDIKVSKVLAGIWLEVKEVFSVSVFHPLQYWDFRECLRVTPQRVEQRARAQLTWGCCECLKSGIPLHKSCLCMDSVSIPDPIESLCALTERISLNNA